MATPTMRSIPLLLLTLCAACVPAPIVVPPEVKDPVVTSIEGGLEAGTSATRTPVTMSATPIALSFSAGELTVMTADTLFQRSASSGTWAAVPVGAPGEVMETGPVRFVGRRGANGLWVVAGGGLFHVLDGRLLKSPVSTDLSGLTVTAVDGYAEGAAEELWLTTSTGIQHVKSSMMRAVEIEFPKLGPLGIASLAVGAGPDQAVVVAKNQAFLVDLGANKATWIARDIGTVNAWSRTDDGSVMLATTTGLYERLKSGEVKRRTLAAAGSAVVAADDVVSALGGVLIAAGGKVARLEGASFKTFGDLAGPRARGLQVDAAGDTFALDAAVLIKLATGQPVSFATDVKPFMAAHCNSCHLTGAQSSPIINFNDYAVTKTYAPLVIKRLKAEGVAPMPPANSEVLSAADYAVVLKWVAGGMQP